MKWSGRLSTQPGNNRAYDTARAQVPVVTAATVTMTPHSPLSMLGTYRIDPGAYLDFAVAVGLARLACYATGQFPRLHAARIDPAYLMPLYDELVSVANDLANGHTTMHVAHALLNKATHLQIRAGQLKPGWSPYGYTVLEGALQEAAIGAGHPACQWNVLAYEHPRDMKFGIPDITWLPGTAQQRPVEVHSRFKASAEPLRLPKDRRGLLLSAPRTCKHSGDFPLDRPYTVCVDAVCDLDAHGGWVWASTPLPTAA